MLVCAATLCASASAKETLVKDVAEFDAAVKAAQPGDEIVMADGEWHDADLVFRATGTDDHPIVVRAQTPGKVVLLGTSRLRFGGEYLTARDLQWCDAAAKDDVVCFRYDSKTLASHCALLKSAIIGDVPDKERKFVSLYGHDNAVVNCRFEEKQSKGTLLVVWLGVDAPPNNHQIRNNFFGPRERLGKNGGEIIRIGDSDTSWQSSKTVVWSNYFYRCDGEAEIISNKSCDNEYSENVFVGCSGALTLRHGNRAKVEGNEFYGDGRKGTGGVRVIGEGHKVVSNLFYELTGDDTRAALCLMNGIPDSPLNAYFQVRNIDIKGNRFLRCKETFVIGNADDDQPKQILPPMELAFVGNEVVTNERPVFIVRTEPLGVTCCNNTFTGGPLGLKEESGWNKVEVASDALESPQALPSDTGPEWMKPGDEFLPEFCKPVKNAKKK